MLDTVGWTFVESDVARWGSVRKYMHARIGFFTPGSLHESQNRERITELIINTVALFANLSDEQLK